MRPLTSPRFTNTGIRRQLLVIFRGIQYHDYTFWSFRVLSCVQKDGRILTGAPRGMAVTLKPSTKASGSAPRVTTWSEAYDLLPPPGASETSAASSAYNTNSHNLNIIFTDRNWRCTALRSFFFYIHVTVHRDVWPCIVTNFFIIKPTRCTNFQNKFQKLVHLVGFIIKKVTGCLQVLCPRCATVQGLVTSLSL
jgi:hypothetical protein